VERKIVKQATLMHKNLVSEKKLLMFAGEKQNR
jgi:hypothetical protein